MTRFDIRLDPVYKASWSERTDVSEVLNNLPPWLTLSLSKKSKAYIALDGDDPVWWLEAPIQGSVAGMYRCLGYGQLAWLGYCLFPHRTYVDRFRMLDDNRMFVYVSDALDPGGLGYAYEVPIDRDQSKINPTGSDI